jgi:hypothetical protein
MHDVVGQRRVEDGRGIELLPGDGRADDGENAGANDRSDAQRGQRPWPEGLFQPMFRLLRIGNQLVNGLACEELVRQLRAPGGAGIGVSGLKQKCEAQGKFEDVEPGICPTSRD